MIRFVDLSAQYKSIKPEVDHAVLGVLKECRFILGPRVDSFEKKFAKFCGVKHAIGVATGLEALRLPLLALGLGPEDEVIVPASTFIATAFAVSHVGAKLVLVDCDKGTGNLDPEAFRRAITPRTKVVIPVHLCGQPANMDAIMKIADERGLVVLEDAAQAAGASYGGKPCGSMGLMGAFSFYPGKNLGAYGDGGAITTDDDALAARMRRLRDYGSDVKYVHLEKGWNVRLDALQAAILEVKLKRLPKWNAARARHAARYRELLAGVGDLAFQAPEPRAEHIYHLFTIETARRDELAAHLKKNEIETVIHYPIPIHLQKAYAELGLEAGSFPNAERRSDRTLSLPMYPELSEAQLRKVAAAVKAFYK